MLSNVGTAVIIQSKKKKKNPEYILQTSFYTLPNTLLILARFLNKTGFNEMIWKACSNGLDTVSRINTFSTVSYKIMQDYYRNWYHDYFNSGLISCKKCLHRCHCWLSKHTATSVIISIAHGRQIKTGDLKCPSEHTQYIPEVQMALHSHPHHSLTASLLPVPD